MVSKETSWDSLPSDLQRDILRRLEFKDLFRFKIVSKACRIYVESDVCRQSRGATFSGEGLFTAINYYIKEKLWRCAGFDLRSRRWRSLPPFICLPPPDAELFKEYSVSGHGGLICADVGKKGGLVIFNPLTGNRRELPPLRYPRSPVLVHLLVTKSFRVIVAGSSSEEHLSRKIEVFDSETSKWEEAPDIPGSSFGLNEYQAGVTITGILYMIIFLEGGCRRGVVAYDVEKRKWLENRVCPIPFSSRSNTLQLLQSDGELLLFSEQEQGRSVEHCIDVLVEGAQCHYWRNVIRVRKSDGRGLQVYPEHVCVPFGAGKVCVFNTLDRDGVVYDIQEGREVDVLRSPPLGQKGDRFFTLNPTSFTLQPRFDSDPA